MMLAEHLVQRYGAIVEPVTFTAQLKERLAPMVKQAFEERTVRIPDNREVRADINSVKRFVTLAGNVRFDAEHTDRGHADRFWALAMVVHAATEPRVEICRTGVFGGKPGDERVYADGTVMSGVAELNEPGRMTSRSAPRRPVSLANAAQWRAPRFLRVRSALECGSSLPRSAASLLAQIPGLTDWRRCPHRRAAVGDRRYRTAGKLRGRTRKRRRARRSHLIAEHGLLTTKV